MSKIVRNPEKIVLRKQIKEQINQIPLESQNLQSKIVVEKILSSDEFKNAKGLSLYLSTANEIDTTEILKSALSLGKAVFVPTYSGNFMEMVRIKDWEDYETLPLTKWNIKQPNLDSSRENALEIDDQLDLFLLPGVAFTIKGERLGHGMGYYDKFLTRYFGKFQKNGTKLYALSFNEQILDNLPINHNDVLLDKVISPKIN